MNGYKIVLLKAILCFIGCRKVNGYAPEYVNWAYINFLQVGNNIILPKFGINEDEQAKRFVQTAFPYCRVRQIDCNAIAKDGGALHCITWNIKKS